jgi:ABC-2 type transport system permease protein
MINYVSNLMKYKDLVLLLVGNDLKVKYSRSYLGYLWSLLNPLLTMVVLTIVFSTGFKQDIPNYPVYLMAGRLIFECNTLCTRVAMNSIVSNSQLLRKVYVPKFIFPLSSVISGFVQLLFSLAALVIVMIFTRTPFRATMLALVIPLFYLFVFSLGLGFFLSALNVFFRDMEHLYSVLITAWMYMTPIFYPASIIPEKFGLILKVNPLHHIIEMTRGMILGGVMPDMRAHVICLGAALVMVVIGLFTFKKTQDRFILYI